MKVDPFPISLVAFSDPPMAVDPEQLTQELREYVATRLARYKVPRVIQIVTELPRTATGKVIRKGLA